MNRKYVLIAEGDVFMTISFNEDQPGAPGWIAGLASSPTVVEVTTLPNGHEITRGWTWDGTGFSAPQ